LACSRANRRASASPNPREPPVMTTTLPENESRDANRRQIKDAAKVAAIKLETFFDFIVFDLISLIWLAG
jgi:hypothetical protein